MNNRAFTLLELLVVITIIGILSSIVIVSMSGSTDSATIAKGKTYAQQVHALLGANAVGVWNFDEGTGTTLTDISGYGNNGTLNKGANGTGLDWVASDIEGTALQFDGVDDYVDCGNKMSLNQNSTITVETWINTNKADSYQRIIANADVNSGSPQIGYELMINSNNDLVFYVKGLLSSGSASIPASLISLDSWYHIVGTYNGDRIRIYWNGINEDTNSLSAGNFSNIKTLYIGRRQSSILQLFSGLIDGVRIYSEALPSTEIQKRYVQGLNKLLANQAITQAEYDQRMEEFNQALVSSL